MKSLLLLTEKEKNDVNEALAERSTNSGFVMTIDSLISQWTDFVRIVEHGYDDSIYEYTNDLSVRDVLEDVLFSVPESTRYKIKEVLMPLDARFYEATKEVERALSSGVKHNALSWWFRIPKKLSKELKDDLLSEGILENK